MRTCFFLLLLFPALLSFAQENNKTCSSYSAFVDSSTHKVIYTSADMMPVFVDSTLDFNTFFLDHLKIQTKKCPASEIMVTFVVEPDGTISHKKVVQTPDCDFNTEIMDVLELIPPMKPGRVKNALVPVLMEYTIFLN